MLYLLISQLFLNMAFADVFPQFEIQECPASHIQLGDPTVAYTNDGDTVKLRATDGTLVAARLVGIDTPETHFMENNQGKWAFDAAARLRVLLPKGQTVQVEFNGSECDSNGRIIATIFKDGVNINRQMLEEGWAINYCVAPNFSHCEEYAAIAKKNIENSVGFLSDPSVIMPYLFRYENRDSVFEYWVGNLSDKTVVSSKNVDQIPIDQRVFFYSRKKIVPPYHLN